MVTAIASAASSYSALTWWGIVPGHETSIARRGPQGRPRRTCPSTSQGAPWGPATPLGEVSWNGTSAPPDWPVRGAGGEPGRPDDLDLSRIGEVPSSRLEHQDGGIG